MTLKVCSFGLREFFVLGVLSGLVSLSGCSTGTSNQDSAHHPLPPIFIDHVFVMVDDPTYEALAKAQWLEEEGLTFNEFNKAVSTWRGHYIQGQRAYLEILSATQMAGHPYLKQSSAIGFYTEEINSLDRIHFRLVNSKQQTPSFAIYESPNSRNSYLGLANVATWVMEVKSTFLKSDNIRRETWSQFFRSKKNFRQTPSVSQLRRIEIDMTLEEGERMNQVFEAIGYRRNGSSSWMGPETQIVIGHQAPYGIKKVVLALEGGAQSMKSLEKTLGSTLVFKAKGTNEVSLTFSPQTPPPGRP